MHATDFWATDTRKVWGKSQMRATYIPDANNPSNPLTSSDDPNKSTLTSPRVLHTFYPTNSVGKKEKTEVGTEVGQGVKRISHKYGYICVGFFLFSN